MELSINTDLYASFLGHQDFGTTDAINSSVGLKFKFRL